MMWPSQSETTDHEHHQDNHTVSRKAVNFVIGQDQTEDMDVIPASSTRTTPYTPWRRTWPMIRSQMKCTMKMKTCGRSAPMTQ